ncbi:MAG: hypothetical protein RRY29_03860 [Desulfovibrionaceae bacterium]
MATIIDALIITLGLDPKGVGTGIAETRNVLDGGVKSIASQIIAPLSAMLAGAFAGGAIVQRFVDAAELGKLSKQLHVGVEDLQAWQGAATIAGGSAQGLLDSAKSLREKTGSRLPITTQLLYMADRLKGLSEIRALELGSKMGLDEGTIKLLRQGRQAVNDLVNQQRELVAFTAQDVAAAQSLKKSYEALKGVFFMVGNVITKLFLPPLRLMSEKLQAAGGIVPWVTEKLAAMSQWIGQNGPQIQNVFIALATILTARMVPALWATARAALSAMLPFLPFILLVAGLALVFDDLMTYINGGESALGDFWAIFGTGPELAAAFAAGWEGVKVVMSGWWEILKQLGKALFGLLTFNPTVLTEAGYAILNIFSDVWSKLNEILGLGEKFGKLMAGASALWGKFTDKLGFGGAAQDAEVTYDSNGMYQAMNPDPARTVSPVDSKGGGNTSVQSETKIDKIEVVTQATDAQGIANDIGGATKNAFNSNTMGMAANSGVQQK